MKKERIQRSWKTIKDEDVRHQWCCPVCKDRVEVTPDWYYGNGTPECHVCSEEMLYIRTDIWE